MRWTPEYVLDGADQVYCRTTATNRHAVRRASYLADRGVTRQWKTEDEQLRVDFVGVGGELCVRKCLEMPQQWDDRDTEGRHDLIYQGHRIDVKTTTNSDPWLIVRKTALHVDAYVLVNYCDGRFRVCGWQTERMVKREENTWKWEHAYTVKEQALRCITELREWAGEDPPRADIRPGGCLDAYRKVRGDCAG
jgi:hypothetical protein